MKVKPTFSSERVLSRAPPVFSAPSATAPRALGVDRVLCAQKIGCDHVDPSRVIDFELLMRTPARSYRGRRALCLYPAISSDHFDSALLVVLYRLDWIDLSSCCLYQQSSVAVFPYQRVAGRLSLQLSCVRISWRPSWATVREVE